MPQKFIAHWVRGGTRIGKFVIYQPTVNYDFTGGFVRIVTNQCDVWPEASEDFKNKSYGLYPYGFSYQTTLSAINAMIGDQTYMDYMASYYENICQLTELQVGDKLVFKNGNYILVTQGADPNPSNYDTYVVLQYRLKDNSIAYENVRWGADMYSNIRVTLCTLPWLLWTNGDYKISNISATALRPESKVYYYNDNTTYDPTSTINAIRFWHGLTPDDPDDPYPDEDDSDDDDGGDGTIPDDDPIDIPDEPDISVSDSGFLTLYNPTMSQVQSLASFMWSGLFDVATFKKLFADPMECILGLNIVPVAVPNTEPYNVKIGNISTDVYMPKVSSQFIKKSCGTLNLGAIHDSYMDFAPYTKFAIYLPYIGIQTLSADDVSHQSLTVEYIVDVLTCACIAFVKAGTHVLYQYAGTCGYNIPLTSENFSRVIGNLAQLAVTVGGAIATGGSSAPLNMGAVASTMNNITGNKPDVHRSGALGGSAGIMGIQKPYLIVEYPNLCKPANQPKYLGYPSFITKKVSDLSGTGYVEFENIIIDGVPCTDEEREAIIEIMKGGVYV